MTHTLMYGRLHHHVSSTTSQYLYVSTATQIHMDSFIMFAMTDYIGASSAMAQLLVHPSCALIDDDVIITATGLEPRSEVTLLVQTEDRGLRFYSYAYFLADESGRVDVSEMAPSGGTYSGRIQRIEYNNWSMQTQHANWEDITFTFYF